MNVQARASYRKNNCNQSDWRPVQPYCGRTDRISATWRCEAFTLLNVHGGSSLRWCDAASRIAVRPDYPIDEPCRHEHSWLSGTPPSPAATEAVPKVYKTLL